jgi:4-oxalocrotonate tautomerase
MPHVAVKLYAGRSEADKQALADEITAAVRRTVGSSDDAVSVSIEDVAPADWSEKVYEPDILGQADKLYKKPGYGPLAERSR